MAIQPNTLEEAAKGYSDSLDKFAEARVSFFEKIALYSGGVISVSITFIGYVLSKNSIVILTILNNVPLYSIIFTGWILLFISLFLGIFIRLFLPEYKSRIMHKEWLILFQKDKIEALELIKKGEATVTGIKKSEIPNWLTEAEKTVNTYENLVSKTKRKLKIYSLANDSIPFITVLCFILGCLLVLLFVGLSVLAIAK